MRRSGRRLAGAGILVCAFSALSVQPALATFHEMMVREVYPGSLAQPGSEYVELQMWTPGQNFVDGHTIGIYNATGAEVGSTTFSNDVPNGVNQSTIVAATPQAESEFKITADVGLSPGLLDPIGGAVCWEPLLALDCVSWGNFSGTVSSPTGQPVDSTGIPDGMALRRTIAPNCPTLLEEADDTNNSAADFADVFPSPRPNSVTPTEHACASAPGSGGGNGGGGGTVGDPQTSFRRKPAKRIHDRTPTFRFQSSESGSTFECQVDKRPFVVCYSPFTTTRLSYGRHAFRVRARDKEGNVDSSPASFKFKVVKKR